MLRCWRCVKARDTHIFVLTLFIAIGSIHFLLRGFASISSKICICGPNDFTGFLPDFEFEIKTEFELVYGEIVTHARLEAFLTTAVTCFCVDGKDNLGDHCQKCYHDTFASSFQKIFDQVLRIARTSTELWCPTRLSLTVLSNNNSFEVYETYQVTWKEIYVQCLWMRLVAVSCKWFCQYNTMEFDALHGYYLEGYYPDILEKKQELMVSIENARNLK